MIVFRIAILVSKMKCSKNINYAVVNGEKITIEQYNKGTPACCENGHPLVGAKGMKNKWHFKHLHSTDVLNPLSEWHCEWQSHFEHTEIKYPTIRRRADIVEGKYVVEIQHSSITLKEVEQRNTDYTSIGKEVIWIVDGTDIQVNGNVLTIDSFWKYQSFVHCEFIYLNKGDILYKVSPSSIKSLTIHVLPIPKKSFIQSIQDQCVETWTDEPIQTKLYVKQQGAGNGKTWGIIHMLSRPEFSHIRKFIYVTKQHTARIIIKDEFLNQQDDLGFTDIHLYEKNKKFIVDYTNQGNPCSVVIATIDSFMYAVGNKQVQSNDLYLFQGITQSIVEGHLDADLRGTIQYAGINPKLNAETLYIVDEAQDLNECYARAVLNIMKKTNMDVYIVGDKLQSIANEINAFTVFNQSEHAIREEPQNVCRRFIHPELISFVNHMIPFQNYELLPVKPYQASTETEQAVFPMLAKMVKDYKMDIEDTVLRIMSEYEKEVDTHGYVPENFLIVVSFVTNNPLANILDLAINQFWIRKLQEDLYRSKLPLYWKEHDVDEYYQYCIFHKSEKGTSINLDDSAHSTRMVSIQASKGDGREVVFVIGVTDSALKMYSGIKDSLRYDSMLHVALTRMKKTLYVVYQPDEIGRKITSWLKQTDYSFDVAQININDSMRVKNLLSEELCALSELSYSSDSEDTKIIEMGHHNIRYGILVEYINELLQDEMKEKYSQIRTQKQVICRLPIQLCLTWKDYNFQLKLIKGFKDKDENWQQERCIPLLKIHEPAYDRYLQMIQQVIKRVIFNCNGNISLCPLELIVLYYMRQISQHPYEGRITMLELYNIFHLYENAFKHHLNGHKHCVCRKLFPDHDNQNSFHDYLQSHYEKMKRIDVLIQQIIKLCPSTDWNIDHNINYTDELSRFVLKGCVPFVGYNETQVIMLYVTPNLTTLNFQTLKTVAIVDRFIVINQLEKYENYDKYHGKEVIIYIIGLNLEEPYRLDLDVEESIKECIARTMYDHYVLQNKEVYYLYQSYRKRYDAKTCIEKFFTNWIVLKETTKSQCPRYVGEFMVEMNRLRRTKTIEELDKLFITELNKTLQYSIDDFLKI